MNLAVKIVELPDHETASILNGLVIDLRPQGLEEEVEYFLPSEDAEFLVKLLAKEALEPTH